MCSHCDWAVWVKDAIELLDKIETLPERANEFATQVTEKIESMLQWVEKNQHVTPRMRQALTNMSSGVNRWL